MKKSLKLIACVIACELAGNIPTFVTVGAITDWYSPLNKPWFNPPNWLFGPAWTILFALMGVALYFVLESKSRFGKLALAIFGVQFILNIAWSFLFFGLQSPLYGLIDIFALLIMIITTIIVFYRVDKKAAYLLVPYWLWVCFASTLNYFIFRMN
ncbi:MAG: TspO/MBR family protein [Candidatus Gracilibacteria bacterium]|jgi:tryptophan-rich sensory protein